MMSDCLAFINYRLIRYRKKIVLQNLRNSFPKKNTRDIKKIAFQFYRNLADMAFELIKSQNISIDGLKKRVIVKNQESFDQLFAEGKNVIVSLGHCGNWEWAGNRIALFIKHEGAAIYKPLSHKFFDEYMINQRQKYKDTLMIDYKKTMRTLVSLRDRLYTVFMLADQSPAKTEINFWTTFMGQESPFYLGMEKIARSLNYAVVYLEIKRIKRGFYEIEFKLISINSSSSPELEITTKYINLIEQSIRANPDSWLWSHRRWKHKKEDLP